MRVFGEIALVCLSSARPTFPGMASGWLGADQMRRVGPMLDALGRDGFCRVVLIHHPPLPGMTSWQRALHDAGAFRAVLDRHGAELVLHGHNHRAMIARFEGRGGPIPIIGVSSASVPSEEPAKRASYNLFSHRPRRQWRMAHLDAFPRLQSATRLRGYPSGTVTLSRAFITYPLCHPCKNVVGQGALRRIFLV